MQLYKRLAEKESKNIAKVTCRKSRKLKKKHLKLDDAEETEDTCKTEEHTGNNGSDKSFCA